MNLIRVGSGQPSAALAADVVPDAYPAIPPPCFYWKVCAKRAVVEKVGRSVCRGCAARLRGVEYPLREPSPTPIYLTSHVAAESLDSVDRERRRDLLSICLIAAKLRL